MQLILRHLNSFAYLKYRVKTTYILIGRLLEPVSEAKLSSYITSCETALILFILLTSRIKLAYLFLQCDMMFNLHQFPFANYRVSCLWQIDLWWPLTPHYNIICSTQLQRKSYICVTLEYCTTWSPWEIIPVIANDEVRFCTHLFNQSFGHIYCELLQIGPNLKSAT